MTGLNVFLDMILLLNRGHTIVKLNCGKKMPNIERAYYRTRPDVVITNLLVFDDRYATNN
jgi:hypothetical protein